MYRFRALPLLLLLASFLGAIPASALERVAYDAAKFQAAQAAGKPTAIHIAATWCETCEAQKAVMAKLASDPALADLTVYVVDYDKQKDVMHGFKANSRATLIVYKGKAEVGRLEWETAAPAILAALAKAK